ncbi:hypothetical protein MMUR_47830 [Mycolicibacterium murale]|uniref:Uncharacterized protein n=1 Tax=Mycolicibacterium murale TaxID=182220 RepID=A0A7I9WTX7_9MYCO|nr:hypothetical protein MMUR_47830 [Mycolicibacterium murale]
MSAVDAEELAAVLSELVSADRDWDQFLTEHPEIAALVPPPEDRAARTRTAPRRPTSEMTLQDGSPLRTPGSDELDVDGDPLGAPATIPVGGVHLLFQAGHGFGIETVSKDPAKPVQLTCRYCGTALTSGDSNGWLCEFGDAAGSPSRLTCGCNWCRCRRMFEQGQLRGRGRPKVQCGSADCKRQLRSEQQRARRNANKVA